MKITASEQEFIRQRILTHANLNYAGKFTRLDIRFRGPLVTIDAYREPQPPYPELLVFRGETSEQFYEKMRKLPTHLCRLRHFRGDRWAVAFYRYSTESYTPCMVGDGWFVTLEAGFDIGAVYLES
ncbi:MAG: hypothetical protein SFY80_03890 [Verrucomicrobiota bacterium]|nr:hypothetical protein [Verrucomicrobiota bacterium]